MLGYDFSIQESRKNLLIDIQEKCQLSKMIISKRMGVNDSKKLYFVN